ncbi:MAG: hypothetical protein ACR2I2_12455 [Bryobacteraceae bacterium]
MANAGSEGLTNPEGIYRIQSLQPGTHQVGSVNDSTQVTPQNTLLETETSVRFQ